MLPVDQLTIHIPILPDKRLGKNASRYQHWGTEAKAKQDLQHCCFGGIMEALQNYRREHGRDWELLERADCHLRIVNAKRRMDSDNCITCLKYAWDCLQGQVIVNDSTLYCDPHIEWVKGDLKETGIWLTIS